MVKVKLPPYPPDCRPGNQFRDKQGVLWRVVPIVVSMGLFTHTIFGWRKQTEEGPW